MCIIVRKETELGFIKEPYHKNYITHILSYTFTLIIVSTAQHISLFVKNCLKTFWLGMQVQQCTGVKVRYLMLFKIKCIIKWYYH